jgi:hypothetical protein
MGVILHIIVMRALCPFARVSSIMLHWKRPPKLLFFRQLLSSLVKSSRMREPVLIRRHKELQSMYSHGMCLLSLALSHLGCPGTC